MDQAVAIAQAIGAIPAEEERAVKIDETRLLRDQNGRCHRERSGNHASNHDREILPPSLRRYSERFGQSAGFVEFDVDGVVFAGECG